MAVSENWPDSLQHAYNAASPQVSRSPLGKAAATWPIACGHALELVSKDGSQVSGTHE